VVPAFAWVINNDGSAEVIADSQDIGRDQNRSLK
jgi:hypothetical protein